MINLSGKHIFIAGGSRGIGAASAKMLAQAGAAVTVTFHNNAGAAESLVTGIQEDGGTASAVQVDLTSESQTTEAIARAETIAGPLTGLVVSAGIFEGIALPEMSLEFWERTMAQNLRTTFLSVKYGAASMRRGGNGGSIAIITSTAGQRGSAVFSAYATSKGAQIMFMRSMALELAPDLIRVNAVAPGWTETDMARASLDELGRDNVSRAIPLGRIGQPNDVAGPIAFLMSDLAQFVTGITLTADGGSDMRG